MWEWITTIHDFWSGFYGKIDSFNTVSFFDAKYAFGTAQVDLLEVLITMSTLFTSMYMMYLSFKFIKGMFKLTRSLFRA